MDTTTESRIICIKCSNRGYVEFDTGFFPGGETFSHQIYYCTCFVGKILQEQHKNSSGQLKQYLPPQE